MNNSRALIFIALIYFLSIPASYADVIDPGEKNVPIFYKINNIDNYPDYVFLLHGSPSPSFMVLNSSEFSFYKLSTASIYAVGKSEFNQSELERMNSTELDNYFKNSSAVIPSSIELRGGYGSVSQSNTLEKVVVELGITSLNQTNLEVKKVRATYFYADGSNKTLEFQDQDTLPAPDQSPQGFDNFWYFILPIVAVVAIILVLFWRRRAV